MGKASLSWIVVVMAAGLTVPALAQEPDPGPDRSAFDASVYTTLRDVINRGADLYNGGDLSGCYRVFEGALMTIRPLLAHRPELQKAISTGLAAAEKDPVMWRRAFTLRSVLDKIRAEVRPAKEKDKEKLPPPKPDDKKKPDEDKKDLGDIQGRVTLNGKPVEGATILFVDGTTEVKATTIKDGTYTIKGVKPGEYSVSIRAAEGKPALPAKFGDAKTSGLKLQVQAGAQNADFDLKADKVDDKKKDEEKKEGDKKDGDKKDGEKKDGEKKDGDRKDDLPAPNLVGDRGV